MKSSDYWKQRFIQLEEAQNQIAADLRSEIESYYRQAQQELEGRISAWYQRLAANNEVSMAEARKLLKNDELKEFKWSVSDYIKHGEKNMISGQWQKQLENASAKFHISKYEALKIQTQQSLETLFSKQHKTISDTMKKVYETGYYHTAYELQKGFNVGFDIAKIPQDKLEKVLSKPWAADGKNFSERIWGNKEKLINEVHGELTKNIMLGADPQKAIDNIAKKMNTSKYNAGRLVMTEEAYFSSASQKDSFEDLDVERYEIVATIDSHTSEICRELDGKVFPMKDYQPGLTAPPFHVCCRSRVAPYFEDDFEDIGERAARGADGKTYYIPDDMNYKQWKETFVDGGDKSGFDVFYDGSALHYSHHKSSESVTKKKEYLTKKKLQAKIADADVQIEDLETKFKSVSGGWSYDEAIKDFGSLEELTDGDDLSKLKDLHSQIQTLEDQKAEWQEKLNEKLKAEQKKSLAKKQIELEAQKEAIQQQLDNFEIKIYSGIWKDDVTTADFSKLNIQGKKDYFQQQINFGGLDSAKKTQFEAYLKQLDELETEGQSYANVQKEMQKIGQGLNQIQADLQNLEKSGIIKEIDDAYTQVRKDAAMWAKSTKEADALLRDKCGEIWRNASSIQRNAIYDYTKSYHKFNEPLRGIEYGSEKFLGVGNVDFDQIGVSYSGWKPGQMRKEINAMTDIIEKSTYDFDVWLQRGCDYKGMDKFFEVPMDLLQHGSQEELENLLLKKEVTEHGFCSCGVAKGKGFSGDIILNIYAPKGTQMMYAEPFSAFGNGSGKNWDGLSLQSSFGQESEIILQQGTKFKVIKVEKTPGTIYFDLEVIEQNPQR